MIARNRERFHPEDKEDCVGVCERDGLWYNLEVIESLGEEG